jgi:DNA-binding transcriptional MerR regulator
VRIGRLAAATRTTPGTLRFYEQLGLLPRPARTEAGYRDYSPGAVERVSFIRRAQRCGLTLEQIGEVLAVRDDGDAPCRHLADLVDERLGDIDERIQELTRTREELAALSTRLGELDPRDCSPEDICAAISHDPSESPSQRVR